MELALPQIDATSQVDTQTLTQVVTDIDAQRELRKAALDLLNVGATEQYHFKVDGLSIDLSELAYLIVLHDRQVHGQLQAIETLKLFAQTDDATARIMLGFSDSVRIGATRHDSIAKSSIKN